MYNTHSVFWQEILRKILLEACHVDRTSSLFDPIQFMHLQQIYEILIYEFH